MIHHTTEPRASTTLMPLLALGFLCLNSLGCNGNSSADAEKEAVRLAKEQFVREFPNIVYDDVIIKSGDGSTWIVEFRTMDDRDNEDLDDGMTWLESPVVISVDGSGKCVVITDIESQ